MLSLVLLLLFVKLCITSVDIFVESSNVCLQPLITGKCKNYGRKRYFFNSTIKRCEKFQYHCGGNDNNFADILDCYSTCFEHMLSKDSTEYPGRSSM